MSTFLYRPTPVHIFCHCYLNDGSKSSSYYEAVLESFPVSVPRNSVLERQHLLMHYRPSGEQQLEICEACIILKTQKIWGLREPKNPCPLICLASHWKSAIWLPANAIKREPAQNHETVALDGKGLNEVHLCAWCLWAESAAWGVTMFKQLICNLNSFAVDTLELSKLSYIQ